MRKIFTTWTGTCFLLFLVVTLGMPLSVSAGSKKKKGNSSDVPPGQPFQALQSQIDALNAQVASLQRQLQDLLAWQQPVSECLWADGPHVNKPRVIIEGCNLQVVNGAGQTNTTNGLGNLIIGYDEPGNHDLSRGGSHNLIVGPKHSFSSYGGLVAGVANEISGPHASVCGGAGNVAEGIAAAVSGGKDNLASGNAATVSGGKGNTASDDYSLVP